MTTRRFTLALGAALVAAPAVAVPPALYTAAQASAGADVFAQNCAMCHGQDLSGGAGPPLVGQSFAAPANKFTIGTTFADVTQQMPANAPGSLTHEQYQDVFAYLLQQNGYPSGPLALTYAQTSTSAVPMISQKP